MLKNKEIIEKLTAMQKLSLLTTGRITPETESVIHGIPVLDVANLQDINKDAAGGITYPSFSSLANSWNCELIGSISAELSSRAKKDNKNAVIIPGLGIKTNVYSRGMSEDPYLCGMLAAANAKAIANDGLMPILANCSINEHDAEFMDCDINKSVIRDYITRPFEIALRESGCGAVMTSCTQLNGNYRDINISLISKILHDKKIFKAHTVCNTFSTDSAVMSVNAENTFLLEGNVKTLVEAYKNYQSLKESHENGKISTEEFGNACIEGNILSEKALNAAVDKILDFAFECDKLKGARDINQSANPNRLSMQASAESIVLLKNEGESLPLKMNAKVAVIGQLATISEDPAPTNYIDTKSKRKQILKFK